MSDALILGLVTLGLGVVSSMIGLAGTMFTAYVAYLMAKLNAGQKEAAIEVKKVKKALEETTMSTDTKLDGIAATGEQTHTLVNNNMAIQLQLNAVLSRRLADMTGVPADQKAAEVAERLYQEHEQKQAAVDAAKRGTV